MLTQRQEPGIIGAGVHHLQRKEKIRVADISLEVLPETVDRRYSSGEPVKGRIRVVVSRACSDVKLIVVICCEAHVKNARFSYDAEKEKGSEMIYRGPWTSGTYDYPFEIKIPQGAHTYDGHSISAVWLLGARAERGDGEILSETKDDPELLIDPAPVRLKEAERLMRKEALYTETGDKLRCCFVVSTALFFGGIAIPLTIGKDDGDSIFFGGVMALLGFLMFIPLTYSALIKKRFREIKVRIAARHVLRGEKVPCSVTFTSKLPFDVERVYVKLTGEEFIDCTLTGGRQRWGIAQECTV